MRIRLSSLTASLRYLLTGSVLFPASMVYAQTDSTAGKRDSASVSVTTGVKVASLSQTEQRMENAVPMHYVNAHPYLTLQQLIKGNLAGVYVQEPSGEPGTAQNIFVRGIASPLLSKKELFDAQAAVYLNGIPLTQDNPFTYEIQKFDFNRIGPATNLLAGINPNNIASIEVVKDPVALASLGPIASNGAIWITTKNAHSGYRQISFNSYFGYALNNNITPVNAAYENNFRQPFYNKFGTVNDRLNYPPYLRDSTNSDYYGPANWTDLYYRNTPIYSADLSLTGGTERANFRFFAGATKNAGNADNTALSRYTGSFFINVAPVAWATVSSMISYNRMNRTRNRNIRDRLAEQRYIPDLTNPLTPNKRLYSNYLNEFNKAIDDNLSNLIQGYVAIATNLKKINYRGRIGFDYNEGIRDAFWPSTLLEGNNFVSNYFGYNQRLVISNALSYDFNLGGNQKLTLEAGQNFMADIYKYDYSYAYNGPNDFIKINIVNGDPNNNNYLQPSGYRVYYYPGKMESRLASFYGNAVYSPNDFLKLNAIIRRDGSSNMQPDNRWFTSYAAGAEWDIKKHLLVSHRTFSSLSFALSASRMGKLLSDDRFNAGPQYRVDLGWANEPTLGSYAGIPGISRPYTNGWVGYGIPWAYNNQLNAGLRIGLFNQRLQVALDAYHRNDKQMLLPIPVPTEWGYTGAYKSGLEVNNRGADLFVRADILPATANGLGWTSTVNLNYNRNKLNALPGGLNELVLGTNKLVVGQPIDAFWLLQNRGVYEADSDVPVNPQTNLPLSFQGVALKAGDPRWLDTNGDYVINDRDKVLTGRYMPRVTGGFGSSFSYKSFALDVHFYAVLGRQVLNQYAASRLDFINTEVNNNIHSVKEITFWEKKQDLSSYPLYNPWSNVVPYRREQDLFLDNASFLKLRSLTLNYDLTAAVNGKKARTFRKVSLYVTGANLLTITSFKGDDPELVNYNGMYTGYGLPIPRTVILGCRVDL